MSELILPQVGQPDWATVLNNALTMLYVEKLEVADLETAANDAAGLVVTAHIAAVDPHGDRAWATGQFLPLGHSSITNARTPLDHAASHATGGSDPITPASIGALTKPLTDSYYEPIGAVASHVAATDPHGDRAWVDDFFLPKTDPSVTNSRTPTLHAGTHGTGGTDPITPAAIGALTQGTADGRYEVKNAVSGHVGAPDPHGDRAWATGQFLPLNHSSVTNARTPTLHAASHATGGTDPITAASIGALSQAVADGMYEDAGSVTAHTAASDPHGDRAYANANFLLKTAPAVTNARTPTPHAASHASGGTDPVTPAAIGALTEAAADDLYEVKNAVADHVAATDPHGDRAWTVGQYLPKTHPSVTNARTPTLHAASHATGGTDPITPASIGAATPAGIQTIADAAVTAHVAATDPHGDRAWATGQFLPLGHASITNARTPTLHAASHATGGTDPITPASIGAITQAAADTRYEPDGAIAAHSAAVDPHGDRAWATGQFLEINDTAVTNARTPLHHADTHAALGSDPITPLAIGALSQADADDRYEPIGEVATHASATDPHGDRAWATGQFLPLGHVSVTNARTPTAHASSHATGGTDPITPGSIGALSQATADSLYEDAGAVAAHVAAADPHGDRAWATGQFLPLGHVSVTNARTPTAHAASHGSAGSDPVTPAAIGALTQTSADGLYEHTGAIATHSGAADPHGDRAWATGQFLPLGHVSVTNARTPTAHASSHATGGTDPITPASIGALTQAVADGLYATPADIPAVGTAAGTVAAGDDIRILGAVQKATLTTKGDLVAASAPGTVQRVGVGTNGQVLIADSAQSAGVRWGDATAGALSTWRRRDLPDYERATSLYTGTAPTISTLQQTTSTISGATLTTPSSGKFNYLGAGDFEFGTVFPDTNYYKATSKYPNTYASGQNTWAVEFSTNSQIVELRFKYISASGSMYRLSINGRKVTDLMQAIGGTTIGSGHILKVDFGSSAWRRLRFDLTTVPFGGVYISPIATIFRPSILGDRLGCLGDSLTGGSGMNTGFGAGTYLYRLARLLGVTDVWNQAVGGTGYVTAGTDAVFGDRVASDIAPYDFDRLIIWGGYNDNGAVQGDISTAAVALYQDIKTLMPAENVLVIGCHSPSGSPATPISNTNATLRAAALSEGMPFLDLLNGEVVNAAGTVVANVGPLITGTGRVGATTGTGNADVNIGTDAVHLTDVGHEDAANRIFSAFCYLMSP